MALPQILQQLGGRLTIPPQVRQLITTIKTAKNPQLLLNQLMQTNPMMQQVMGILNQYGGDANKALNDITNQCGITQQELSDLIKGI